MTTINNSKYLKSSLENLSEINGELIIYGCSFDEVDNHIWELISSNNDLKILAGVDDDKHKQRVKEVLNKTINDLEFYYLHQERRPVGKGSSCPPIYGVHCV